MSYFRRPGHIYHAIFCKKILGDAVCQLPHGGVKFSPTEAQGGGGAMH